MYRDRAYREQIVRKMKNGSVRVVVQGRINRKYIRLGLGLWYSSRIALVHVQKVIVQQEPINQIILRTFERPPSHHRGVNSIAKQR
jgi:hypothetical protein